MRSGTTLLELLLVLAVLALLTALGAPRAAALLRTGTLTREALHLVEALDAARGAAIRLGAPVTLTLGETEYRADAVVGTDTVVAWRAPAAGRRGVTLTGATPPLRFGAAGLALGASNRTLVLRRGVLTRRVVISRLGRITP